MELHRLSQDEEEWLDIYRKAGTRDRHLLTILGKAAIETPPDNVVPIRPDTDKIA